MRLPTPTGVSAVARNISELKLTNTGSFSLAVKGDNATAANVTFNVSATTRRRPGRGGEGVQRRVVADRHHRQGQRRRRRGHPDQRVGRQHRHPEQLGQRPDLRARLARRRSDRGERRADLHGQRRVVGHGDEAFTAGTLEFNSDKGFSFDTANSTSALVSGMATGASSLNSVNTIDVSSVDGATKALKIIDSALAVVNGQRASFGALQSRFETTVANLQSTAENLSASRSRIQDADFAPKRPTCRAPRCCSRPAPR
jgi:flagellin